MGRLGSILLQLDLFNFYSNFPSLIRGEVSLFVREYDVSVLCKWLVSLCDLVPRRKVWVKVVFSIESAEWLDFAMQTQRGADGSC